MAQARGLLDTLNRDLDRALDLITAVQKLRAPKRKGFPALPYLQVALVAELAFLRCFIAWETFIEEVFVSYARGKAACDGTVFPCFLSAPTEAHLRNMIIGERRGFAPWSDVSSVRKRAKLYFPDGEPFVNVLDSASTALNDMVIVRNRIAHRAPSASRKFLDLVQSRHGTIPPGINPGRFLLGPGTNPSMRRVDEYVEVLRLAARQIAQG